MRVWACRHEGLLGAQMTLTMDVRHKADAPFIFITNSKCCFDCVQVKYDLRKTKISYDNLLFPYPKEKHIHEVTLLNLLQSELLRNHVISY